jgi:hypothetical protein
VTAGSIELSVPERRGFVQLRFRLATSGHLAVHPILYQFGRPVFSRSLRFANILKVQEYSCFLCHSLSRPFSQ